MAHFNELPLVTFADMVREAAVGKFSYIHTNLTTNARISESMIFWAKENIYSEHKNLRLLAAKIISLKESQQDQTDADSKML